MPIPHSTGELRRSYARWRASQIGHITDRLEQELLLELLGPVSGQTLLDVGCGDGILAGEIARRGSVVTGLDADALMIAAARQRAEARLSRRLATRRGKVCAVVTERVGRPKGSNHSWQKIELFFAIIGALESRAFRNRYPFFLEPFSDRFDEVLSRDMFPPVGKFLFGLGQDHPFCA